MEMNYDELLLQQKNHIESLESRLKEPQSNQAFSDLYSEICHQKMIYANMLTGHTSTLPHFKSKEHHDFFYACMQKSSAPFTDVERISLFYVLGISPTIRKYIDDFYNFEENVINFEILQAPYQTNSLLSITKLAFQLYNDYCNLQEPTTLLDIFAYVSPEDIPYLFDGIQLRLSILKPSLQES